MDWQTLFNAAVPIGAGVFGWFMKTLWEANKEVRRELTDLRIHIPETYLPKSDFREFETKLFEKLDKIESKLDQKQDR